MQDILSILNTLHRPRLLIRAARIGAEDYRRAAHLPRVLGYGQFPRHGAALMRLMELEVDLNTLRLDEDSSYSLLRHIDILIAIIGESRILRAAQVIDCETQTAST